jgi:hypothetical protein
VSCRIVTLLASSAFALLAAAPHPAPSPTPPDTRPLCVRTTIAIVEQLDSSRTVSGQRFTFRTVDAATAPDGTVLPTESIGYGIVAHASHGQRSGVPGYLALEARFVIAPSGAHVPIVIDHVVPSDAIVSGGTADAPFFLGIIPIVSYGVGVYNFVHHGKDATIPFGTRIPAFVGDDVVLGTCRSR